MQRQESSLVTFGYRLVRKFGLLHFCKSSVPLKLKRISLFLVVAKQNSLETVPIRLFWKVKSADSCKSFFKFLRPSSKARECWKEKAGPNFCASKFYFGSAFNAGLFGKQPPFYNSSNFYNFNPIRTPRLERMRAL